MLDWHYRETDEVVRQLGSDAPRGLSESEAARRLAEYGPNAIVARDRESTWRILRDQLTATMVVVLMVAAGASALLGDYSDAAVILAIVVLNALLGFSQEYQAERAMLALKQLAVPHVRVRRDGSVREISASDLVPGDIALLEVGNLVPADGRLLVATNLRMQEALLTGESEAVDKVSIRLDNKDLPLGDRHNMVYMGTVVTCGRGEALVTETGMATELGRIASMMQDVKREPTPLQHRLDHLGKQLALVALLLVGIIFIMGLMRGEDLRVMFLTAVSVGVAAVPEGLPAVVTIALALGARRMLARRALIRKLPAVETLGSVTVICSDKTGTLTENRMTVTVFDVAGNHLDLTEQLRDSAQAPERIDERHHALHQEPALALLLAGGTLCNDVVIGSPNDGREDCFQTIGDPTEGALAVAAARFGFWKGDLESALPRVTEEPFESERKRMTTVHALPACKCQAPPVLEQVYMWCEQAQTVYEGEGSSGPGHEESPVGTVTPPYIAFTKGAVDSLLQVSSRVWYRGQAEPITQVWRERIEVANNGLAQSGMRVLGVAFRPLRSADRSHYVGSIEGLKRDGIERDLIFVGMLGMIDPARPEVEEAVQTCVAAGIRPLMITGDHPLTARYIARDLGICGDGRVVTGHDLDLLTPEGLEEIVERKQVYARVSPEHKLKIVQALQRRGHIVAMTGDGVNDAPALKKADIGVAMGITGTDVSKEAADMVLLDDNFATIVAAVGEGRVIYDNIRKFVRYILTSNSGELWLMLLAPILAMPLPLLPLQILWINLVTDGLPALALGLEPAEPDYMRRPPYPPGESIFGRGMARQILWVGLLMGLVSLGTGYWYWQTSSPAWQTMIFTVLTFSQLGLALAVRSARGSLLSAGLFTNKLLLAATMLTVLLQLAVVYTPFLQGIFGTVPLGVEDLALCLLLSTAVFWYVELEKLVGRRQRS